METVGIDDEKNTISSRLVDRLRESIVSGALQPGAKINLDKVRAAFDVSLSPLREALARLIADGLVEFEDNRGYWVAPLSLVNLEEVTALRLEFEIYALRRAIADGDVVWEGEVVGALHRLSRTERDSARPETFERWEVSHRRFHMTLLSGCGMPTLMTFCRKLLNLNDRYRRIFLRNSAGDRNVPGEHSEIANAAIARDADFATRRLAEHIRRTGENLLRYIADNPGPGIDLRAGTRADA
jgi:DNA-binding GntR family transcriptional regulator